MNLMNLRAVFQPKTMCVVGVSQTNPLNPGTVIYQKNMHEMEVEVFGVNPRGGFLEDRELYRSVSDVPKDVDLAVICVRAPIVNGIVEECGEAGVKGVVVVSGGFAEVGGEGVERQRELAVIAEKYDLALIGPNCVGVYSPPYVDTFFLPSERLVTPPPGRVAVISQSGGVLVDQFFSKYAERKIGVSAAVSVGNKAVVDETLLLEYFKEDSRTGIVAVYLEGFEEGEGAAFLRKAAECFEKKPVIVFRAGKTEYGRRATVSHTGSVMASLNVASAAFKQWGVIEVETEYEITTFSKVLSFELPSIHDGNVVILTISGGHGVICSDLCARYGLKLVEFTEDEMRELQELLNPSAAPVASLRNPIDLTGSVVDRDVERVLERLMEMDKVEAVILLMLPYPPTITMQLGRRASNIARKYRKPVVAYVPWVQKYQMIVEGLELNGVPVGHTVEEAVQMVKALKMRGEAEEKVKMRMTGEQTAP
ncbi:MAG: CoA-binding protein [Candidatus Freyarchaeota archaeon]|nr:CoA-binding protein [Candidatus Freyrarchaeum guaymaensis]